MRLNYRQRQGINITRENVESCFFGNCMAATLPALYWSQGRKHRQKLNRNTTASTTVENNPLTTFTNTCVEILNTCDAGKITTYIA